METPIRLTVRSWRRRPVVWLVVAGWWLALGHILTGIAQLITIIGIPVGLANFKLVPVSLFPPGHEIVDS